MFCSQCGFQNAEGDRFCGRCGAPLRAAAPAGGPMPASAPIATPQVGSAYPPVGGTLSPARKTKVPGIAIAGVAVVLLGAAGAYFARSGGSPLAPRRVPAQAYADPDGHFKIQYPQGWKSFTSNDLTVFSQADIGSAGNFAVSKITVPTIVVFRTEKSEGETTAAQAFTESGLEKEHAQILGQRSGNPPTASGASDAVWVDFLITEPSAPPGSPQRGSKQMRGRVMFAVRHPGGGTTVKGSAACLAPPKAFAAFERACADALDSYELGN